MNNKASSGANLDDVPDELLVLENLKRVWGISDEKKKPEPAPRNVSTNIYSVPPATRRPIPNRRTGA